LNIFFVPTDEDRTSQSYESVYYDLIEKVKNKTKLPLSVKLGPHFTDIIHLIKNLYYRGAAGVVLFNSFYSPDIDIDNMKFTFSDVLSNNADIHQSLRWVGIVSGMADKIDIAASIGIHDGKAAIKQILAGAKAVQICSVLYRKGLKEITSITGFIDGWLNKNNFKSIDEIRGKMNYKKISYPTVYDRAQFMKYFSN
jgi:dihydroorotate dehydrogenase (fumarate)